MSLDRRRQMIEPAHPRLSVARETVQNLGGAMPGLGFLAGDAMRWRVMLDLAGSDGARQVQEVGAGERPAGEHTAATLGLGLTDGKAILAAVQRHLVAAQVDEHCRARRRCGY